MNRLIELNNYSNELIEFVDSRDSDFVLSPSTPVNQTIEFNEGQLHYVPIGIDIIEVINYTTFTLFYEIDLTNAPEGYTIDFGTLPLGVTLTNPSTDVYRISGIISKLIWDAIKSPGIDLPNDFVGVFTYTASLISTIKDTINWTVTATANPVNDLLLPNTFGYQRGQASQPFITTDLIDSGSTTGIVYTLTFTLNDYVELIDTITTTSSLGTFTFNNTTKNFVISGSFDDVNDILDKLFISTLSTYDLTVNYTILLEKNITDELDTVTQELESITEDISFRVRASDTYTVNQIASISGGPLINGSIDNDYTVEIYSKPQSAVTSILTNLSNVAPSLQQEFVVGQQTLNLNTLPFSYALDTQWEVVKLSNDGSTLIIGLDKEQDNSNAEEGNLYVYDGVNGEFTLNTVLKPKLGANVNNGRKIAVSGDGNRIIMCHSSDRQFNPFGVDLGIGIEFKTYQKVNGVWSLIDDFISTYTPDLSDTYVNEWNIELSPNGNKLVIYWDITPSNDAPENVYVFTWDGTTYDNNKTKFSIQTFGVVRNINESMDLPARLRKCKVSDNHKIVFLGEWITDTDEKEKTFLGVYYYSGSSYSQQFYSEKDVDQFVPYIERLWDLDINSDASIIVYSDSSVVNINDTSAPYVHVLQFDGTTYAETQKIVGNANGQGREIALSSDAQNLYIYDSISQTLELYTYNSVSNLFELNTSLTENFKTIAVSKDFSTVVALKNSTVISGTDFYYEVTAKSYYQYIGDNLSPSYDSNTGILTITGDSEGINLAIDKLKITPSLNYNQDFDLLYKITDPNQAVSIRNQNIRKI